MDIPAVVLAAVAAALLTGLFSFVNLILSKELKISDARLAWNDALRVDLSEMLAHVETLARLAEAQLKHYRANDPNHPPGFTDKELAEFRHDDKGESLAMYVARHRVELRLNPEEHRDLAVAIDQLFVIFLGDCSNTKDVYPASVRVVVESQNVLRSTWRKVKDGEPAFVRTKNVLFYGLVAIAIFAVLSLLALFWFSKSGTTLTPAPTPSSSPTQPGPTK